MTHGRWIILLTFVALLGIPLVFRPHAAGSTKDAMRLIVITPHNEQIRFEFSRAFSAWARDSFYDWSIEDQRNALREAGLIDGTEEAFDRWLASHRPVSVEVVFNVPGGTSEIRKMLEAQYRSDLEKGGRIGGTADMVFGGGSYEHSVLKRRVTVLVDGRERSTSISSAIALEQAWLDRVYGENRIGDLPLYDADRHWFGVALSGFGIVYNRDVLRSLGLAEPTRWADLCSARLRGWVAGVNPGQSGSVTTAFEAILQQQGWLEGWQVLRRMGANSRYFSASSLKPPADVSQGDAAMGVSIDFYGRFQSQAVMEKGGGDRVGYVDPPGETMIDPDPISVLVGAPHPTLARKFIEFCLSERGQTLWQYRVATSGDIEFGPQRFELRRMPIVREMYEPHHLELFIDRVNPFELARPVRFPDRNYRAFIATLYASMIMDTHGELRRAWGAIADHPAYPSDAKGLVTSEHLQDPTLRKMLDLFDTLPTIEGPDGAVFKLDSEEHLAIINEGWFRRGWQQAQLWPDQSTPADEMRRQFSRFYREQYRRIVELATGGESSG